MPSHKKKKYGICRICTKYGELTDDHVPPKGGMVIKPIAIRSVFNLDSQVYEKENFHYSQNGIKFPTVCKKCNSNLGSYYDPVLNTFAKNVKTFLESSLLFHDVISIETKPCRLIRAVLGHLLAAKYNNKDSLRDSEFDEKVRDIIFNESASIPDDINIFYWVYPYESIIIIRDLIMPAIRGNFRDNGFFHILKYYPIAYLVSDKKEYENLLSLNMYKSSEPNKIANIAIRINDKPQPADWPEMGDQRNFNLIGKTSQYDDKLEEGIKAEAYKKRIK